MGLRQSVRLLFLKKQKTQSRCDYLTETPNTGLVETPLMTTPTAAVLGSAGSPVKMATITATSPPPAPPTAVFPLLQLAPELRQRIFECFFSYSRFAVHCGLQNCEVDCRYASTYDGDDEFDDTYGTAGSRLAITRVSKIVRYESIAAMLRVGRFDFQLLDNHPNWRPDPLLREYIGRMKHLYGPPRLLHYLSLTTLPWCTSPGMTIEDSRWVESCAAEHVVCDMVIDAFDIQDAVADMTCSEGQYFEGLKNAIAGPRGARLTLCIQLEDSEPTWNGWDEPHIRSGFQIYKQKVIVRKRPKTELGKINLKTTLLLLGVELEEKDQRILDPVKQDTTQAATQTTENPALQIIPTDTSVAGGVEMATNESDNQASNDTTATTTTVELEPPTLHDSALEWWNGDEDY